MRVLIIGGYGTFGGRLARLLSNEWRLVLLLAGRSEAKARRMAEWTRSDASLIPFRFDRDGDLAAQLAEAKADLVVDASGPFQAYGREPYRVAQACIAAGVSYIDLADSAAFVAGIAALDSAAKAAGVFVRSGVSTCPALSTAAVRRLAEGWSVVRSVSAGIAPTPWSGMGLSVVQGIAGYAGKPVTLVRGGRRTQAPALVETRRVTIAPPGVTPLRNLRFSLVDTPDLRTLPAMLPGLRDVWFGAGTTPEILQRMLNALALLVRWRLIPTLRPLATIFHWAINRLRWGEHRGGMFVAATGEDADRRPVRRSWHLVAEGDDGPFIPSMAAEALIRKMLDGQRPEPGAQPSVADLQLSDFEAAFARRAIRCGVREEIAESEPVYRQVMAGAFDAMPDAWRAVHDLRAAALTVEGRAMVKRGRGLLARLVGAVVGFPRAGDDVPVSVRFERRGNAERWTRTFGGKAFASLQEPGQGRSVRLIVERFGPLAVAMSPTTHDGRISLIIRRFSLFGVPLPLWLSPTAAAHEEIVDGRFHFDVEIGHPLTGMIVLYRGWLAPAS